MNGRAVWTIARRELRESLRHKWLWAYVIGFAALAMALSGASLAAAGYAGLGGFGRTAASLVNALLLFVPLLGLSIGAGSVAGDRERGTLLYVLSQPVSRSEVLAGKVLGAGLALSLAVILGFGLAALALSIGPAGDGSAFLAVAAYTLLLGWVMLGVGFLISVSSKRAAPAFGIGLLVWIAFVFLSDLGVIGATLAFKPTPAMLLAALVVNPLQAYKLGAILSLQSSLDVLGAIGQYATRQIGVGLPWALAALLLLWAAAAFSTAFAIFSRRNDQ